MFSPCPPTAREGRFRRQRFPQALKRRDVADGVRLPASTTITRQAPRLATFNATTAEGTSELHSGLASFSFISMLNRFIATAIAVR